MWVLVMVINKKLALMLRYALFRVAISRTHKKKRHLPRFCNYRRARSFNERKKTTTPKTRLQTLVDTVQSFLCCTQGWQKKQQQKKVTKSRKYINIDRDRIYFFFVLPVTKKTIMPERVSFIYFLLFFTFFCCCF
jgi:hypothetical protein